ncbi:MAG: hypothetical protein ABH846_00510 [Patescibacteria group bacterium]
MIDVTQLAKSISGAPISKDEKIAWLKLVPYMPEEDLQKLIDTFVEHRQKVDVIRNDYLEQVQQVIDEDKADELVREIA